MALTRWEPSGMRTLRDQLNRMFEDVMIPSFRTQGPSLDVYTQGNDVVVEAELPGMDIKDVEINATENMVTIQGQTQRESEVQDENLFRAERRWGSFFRTVELPVPIDPEQAKASFNNGVLTLRAPLSPTLKPRKVSINRQEELVGGSENRIDQQTDQA